MRLEPGDKASFLLPHLVWTQPLSGTYPSTQCAQLALPGNSGRSPDAVILEVKTGCCRSKVHSLRPCGVEHCAFESEHFYDRSAAETGCLTSSEPWSSMQTIVTRVWVQRTNRQAFPLQLEVEAEL